MRMCYVDGRGVAHIFGEVENITAITATIDLLTRCDRRQSFVTDRSEVVSISLLLPAINARHTIVFSVDGPDDVETAISIVKLCRLSLKEARRAEIPVEFPHLISD